MLYVAFRELLYTSYIPDATTDDLAIKHLLACQPKIIREVLQLQHNN